MVETGFYKWMNKEYYIIVGRIHSYLLRRVKRMNLRDSPILSAVNNEIPSTKFQVPSIEFLAICYLNL